MLFFQRILKQPEQAGAGREERRSTPRYAIRPEFNLKASLSFASRGQTRSPLGGSRSGLSVKCNLLDCSEGGVRVQTGPGLKLKAHDPCDPIASARREIVLRDASTLPAPAG